MPRVKTGTTRRAHHKKILKTTKGYRMTKSRLYKVAREASLHAGAYAFAGRRKKKGQFRSLWIKRINAGLQTTGSALSYSKFIRALIDQKITLNRKMLAFLAVKQPNTFQTVVKAAVK